MGVCVGTRVNGRGDSGFRRCRREEAAEWLRLDGGSRGRSRTSTVAAAWRIGNGMKGSLAGELAEDL